VPGAQFGPRWEACLLTALVVIALSWLAVCVVAMLTDALPTIGAIFVDLIEALITRPLHDPTT
jgi:hypothetical protein